MPVLVTIEVPGGSSQLDDALVEAWNLTRTPPAGNRLRLAGPIDDGWRVVSLWDSREQFEEFLEARLNLTLQDAGDGQPSIEYWDVETVHRFDASA